MRGLFLFLLALVITIMFFYPLLFIQIIQKHNKLNNFLFNVAIHLDYLWASLLFGVKADGHTISAIVYKRMIEGDITYTKYVNAINFMFNDKKHCFNAFTKEFRKETI